MLQPSYSRAELRDPRWPMIFLVILVVGIASVAIAVEIDPASSGFWCRRVGAVGWALIAFEALAQGISMFARPSGGGGAA